MYKSEFTKEFVEECRTKQNAGEAPGSLMVLAMLNELDRLREENERLRGVINRAASYWLTLVNDYPVQWEGALDGAMEVACQEIATLVERANEAEAELEQVKAERDDALERNPCKP